MKKLSIVLALIVLGLVIVGCGMEPSTTTDVDLNEISADVDDLNDALDSDLSELDALDQELADLEALDLG